MWEIREKGGGWRKYLKERGRNGRQEGVEDRTWKSPHSYYLKRPVSSGARGDDANREGERPSLAPWPTLVWRGGDGVSGVLSWRSM